MFDILPRLKGGVGWGAGRVIPLRLVVEEILSPMMAGRQAEAVLCF